jgi:hypothetical protein
LENVFPVIVLCPPLLVDVVAESGVGGPVAAGGLVVLDPLGTLEVGTVALAGGSGDDLNVRTSHKPMTVRAIAAMDRRTCASSKLEALVVDLRG